jgi:hypothetical protein
MTDTSYAFIKNGNVVNVVLFNEPTEDLLNIFIEENGLDSIIPADYNASVGGTYDGEKFWKPQPYNSWIKNEELNEWQAPVPYPVVQDNSNDYYVWDENTISWVLNSNSI